jgi:hypothetical protein
MPIKNPFLQKFYTYRWIIFQLIFIVLILFAQKPFIGRVIDVIYNKQINYRVAGIIALAFVFETVGVIWKVPLIHKRYVIDKSQWFLFFWLLMHAVVGLCMVMTLIAAISGTGTADVSDTPYEWLMILIFLEVMRHIVIPCIIVVKVDGVEIKENPVKEILSEFFILFWTFVAYTFTWSAMTSYGGFWLWWTNIGLTILYTVCAALLFWVFYLWTNLVWILQQYEQAETKVQRLFLNISFVVITIIALYPLYKVPAVN